MKRNTALALILIVILAGAVWLIYTHQSRPLVSQPPSMASFANATQGIKFSYPTGYYLKEKETGTPAKPIHSIVLVSDTPDNRAIIDGTAKVTGDGPTAITVDIYQNPSNLSARDWVKTDTNWTVATKRATDVTVAGTPGITYSWSGLYEGKSFVIPHGNRVYVFSVTWLTPGDKIIQDFQELLSSVSFSS